MKPLRTYCTIAPLKIVGDKIMTNVGYVRVSSVDQNTDRQLAGVELDKVFTDKLSAKTIERPELKACLDYLRDGDTLHIHSLDRVCRSGAGDAVNLVDELLAKGVTVIFHKESMTFTRHGKLSAVSRGLLAILASVAEMERNLIRERQLEGIAVAKAKGKHMGRPKADSTLTPAKIAELRRTMTVKEITEMYNISRTTVYNSSKVKDD